MSTQPTRFTQCEEKPSQRRYTSLMGMLFNVAGLAESFHRQPRDMLFLDGVYVSNSDPAPVFCRVPAPTAAELQRILERISQRIGRYLERQGLLVRDPQNDYLQLDAVDEEAAGMDSLRGHSITLAYRHGSARR